MPPSVPSAEQHHDREQDEGGLGQEGAQKQQHGESIAPVTGSARGRLGQFVRLQESQQRGESKRQGERVLRLADPCRRRDVQRMQGEDQTGEPRSRHAQPLQHAPGQDRAQRMERNVDQVVAEH